MKIRELQLYTNELDKTKAFYTTILAFELIDETENQFSLQIDWTKLTFVKSEEEHIYHFSFLVDKTLFDDAFVWMKKRVEILNTIEENQIAFFENWNAKSFYFYDGAGNLAEIITHQDIDYQHTKVFNQDSILGISEIGLPTLDIKSTNQKIEEQTTSKFWKGDFEVFGTNGTDEGKILLPNYLIKTTWFPTNTAIQQHPFELVIESENRKFLSKFIETNLEISSIK